MVWKSECICMRMNENLILSKIINEKRFAPLSTATRTTTTILTTTASLIVSNRIRTVRRISSKKENDCTIVASKTKMPKDILILIKYFCILSVPHCLIWSSNIPTAICTHSFAYDLSLNRAEPNQIDLHNFVWIRVNVFYCFLFLHFVCAFMKSLVTLVFSLKKNRVKCTHREKTDSFR